MQPFHRNMFDLIESIEDCLARHRILPCLTLLYSGIDVVASLDRQSGESSKASFVRWAERYLLTSRKLPCAAIDLYAARCGVVHTAPCAAIDLYAARCGVVHTFTAASTLSGKRQVRLVGYAWGTAEAEKLAAAATLLQRNDCVIHVRDLIDAFRNGVTAYLEDVEMDSTRRQKFESNVGLWFTQLDREPVDRLLDMAK